MRKVAVITDAMSPAFWFPFWYGYYGRLFGALNLHVLTYRGLGHLFSAFALGSLREIPHDYEDELRSRVMTGAVTDLLATHDVVLRVDVDEVLVADPVRHADLAAYVQSVELPYVTARGFNVLVAEGEAPLDRGHPILGLQRRWVYPLGTMNKTALTRIVLDWGPGFHFCTQRPQFDDLYLFHLKHADLAGLTAFGDRMRALTPGNARLAAYFDYNPGRLTGHQTETFSLPRGNGTNVLLRDAFNAKFLDAIVCNPHTKRYRCEDMEEGVVIEVPRAFWGLL